MTRGRARDRGQAERAGDDDRPARSRGRERLARAAAVRYRAREDGARANPRRATDQLRDDPGRERPAQRLPDAAAEPHRRLGDGGGQPARALHVPAPDRDPRPHPGRRGANASPARAIALEAEVAARTEQLRELAQHLQTIREDERSRLARELHDELGALLTAAKLDVARLKSRLGATITPDATERLAHLNETLNGGIALKRRIIEDLRPSSLSNLGLVAALEILLREFAARSEIEVVDELGRSSSMPAAQLTVYRLVQEALTNVVKYAKAREVVGHAGADRRRRRAGRGQGRRRRLRHPCAAPGAARSDRHALSGRSRGRDDAAGVEPRRRHADRGDPAGTAPSPPGATGEATTWHCRPPHDACATLSVAS